jgi:hypothetical protein
MNGLFKFLGLVDHDVRFVAQIFIDEMVGKIDQRRQRNRYKKFIDIICDTDIQDLIVRDLS